MKHAGVISTQLIVGTVFAVILGLFYYSRIATQMPSGIITPIPQKILDSITSSDVRGATTSVGHSLTPVISNQWFSTVFSKFPTKPMYAFPLSFTISDDGLGFSSPDIKKTENTIFAPYTEDFTVGLEANLKKPEVTHVGDWSVNLTQKTSKGDSISYFLAQGIPYTSVTSTGKELYLNIPNDFTLTKTDKTAIKDSSFKQDAFVITTRNHTYLIASADAMTIKRSKKTLIISSTNLLIALLDVPEHAEDFKKLVGIDVNDTQAKYEVLGSSVRTSYTIGSNNIVPLTALMPHHTDHVSNDLTELGNYSTLRGPMKLVRTSTFSTSIPFEAPAQSFTKASEGVSEITGQLKKDAATLLKDKVPDSKDYYLGTWMGKVTTLIQLADTYGLQKEKQQLINVLKPQLIKSMSYFVYDNKMTSMIATKPEFGNEKLNDHHFHYGYFIRAAAVLASYDPTLMNEVKADVNELVADIMTTDRSTTRYPYLRNFSVFEGHSWADGFGEFNDGTNQESSSEAINAWYAVYLWSNLTKNDALKRYAAALYATEIQSTFAYWFDKDGIYSKPYEHRIASIVWGGKVDFATWFSDSTNMKYGIQLLPFTPASTYLAGLPSFANYEEDFADSKGDVGKEWGDLFVMWKAMYNPEEAMTMKDKVTKFEGNNTRSNFLHFLYTAEGK
ncbi:MAG: hypothetical protein RI947_1532 [Candidatus Parcubacteria bacterium]|jgi:endoglucanase Acf2